MGLLEGKVAFITGAGSGIGQGSAMAFAREGAKVVAADINAEGGAQTVDMIKAEGGDAAFVECNVADAAAVEAAVKFVVDTYGSLDCAFNNAGIDGDMGPLAAYTEDVYDKVMAVNVKGVFLCMKYEIQQMLTQGGGSIVNTASIAGLVGVSNLGVYNASKHAVNGFTKAGALEYAESGIRVNSVCPGAVRTPILDHVIAQNPAILDGLTADIPAGRIGETEEIGAAAAWLCSDASSYVTGHTLAVDGGYVAR